MNSFIEDVDKLREIYCRTYQVNRTSFLAAFNRETRLAEDYNGRQILELLQNADDAHAKNVRIKLNRINNTISIANTGRNEDSFSVAGVESLLVSDFSPKSKWSSIGNKGLGFRSLISWCDCIKIKSNSCCLTFSKEVAYNFLTSKIKDPSKKDSGLGYSDDDINSINMEKEYKPDSVCFPILGIPKIDSQEDFCYSKDNNENNWITEIELTYKKDPEILKAIEYQISEKGLNDNILLFLNNIKKIIIEDELGTIRVITSQVKETIIDEEYTFFVKEINGILWNIYSSAGEYPEYTKDNIKLANKTPKYSAMIAWKDTNLAMNNLYTYFPTQITLKLPFIIHGSFKIDTARNHLIQEDVGFKNNEFIFDKIITLIEKGIRKIQSKTKESNWESFKFIQSENLPQDTNYFNEKLENLKQTLAIYPAVNNTYLTRDAYIYYSDEWSVFSCNEKYKNIYCEMVKAKNKEDHTEIISKIYPPDVLKQKIEKTLELMDDGNALGERQGFSMKKGSEL